VAEIKTLYGSAQTLTISGAATLANSSSVTSPAVDNTTTNYLDVLAEIQVTTGTGATLTGYVEIWLKGSIDNTDFDDDVNDKWVGTIAMAAAGAQTRKRVVSLAAGFNGSMPNYWQLRIRNVSGGALGSGTPITVSWVGLTAQTV
jgi:hypothetical protein